MSFLHILLIVSGISFYVGVTTELLVCGMHNLDRILGLIFFLSGVAMIIFGITFEFWYLSRVM